VSFSFVVDGSELGAGIMDGIDGMSFMVASFVCHFNVLMYLCVNIDAMAEFGCVMDDFCEF
jgi:hypothetical protein